MSNKVLLKKSSVAAKTPLTSDLDYGELALNYADGKLYFKNSSNVVQSFGSTSSVRVTTTTTAVAGKTYIADTSGGTFTLTLPASPASGDTVTIQDGANFNTTALTVGRNSQTIEGISQDLSLNISGVSVTLTFDGTTWHVFTQVGAQGGTEVTLSGIQTLTNKTISGSSNTLSNIGNSSLTNSSVTVNGTSISLGDTATVTAAAGTLTGTTLNSTVVSSSLTSVGILNGLTSADSVTISYNPGTTTGVALTTTGKDTIGGTGYFDFFKAINTTSGVSNGSKTFRLNSTGNLEIINSAYTVSLFNLSNSGDLVISGTLTQGTSRPAFRVIGGGTTNINATNTLTSSNFTVDYNQGSHLNTSTGIFTAPIAGLYQVGLVARFAGSGSISAIQVQKYSSGVTSTQVYLEWAGNSTSYHMGGSAIVRMAVGDTLKLIVTSGTVTFDSNDQWSVAYIG